MADIVESVNLNRATAKYVLERMADATRDISTVLREEGERLTGYGLPEGATYTKIADMIERASTNVYVEHAAKL